MPKPFYAAGAYVGEVLSQALGQTSNGNMQFVVRFKVLGTPDPENPENYLTVPQQLERTIYIVITEKSIEIAMESLQALGFERDSFRYLDPNTSGYQNFVGATFDAWCKHEDYNGEPHEKWSVSKQGGAPQVKPIDAARVRQLDALFAKQLKGIKKNGGGAAAGASAAASQPRTSAPPASAAPVTDDDVPF